MPKKTPNGAPRRRAWEASMISLEKRPFSDGVMPLHSRPKPASSEDDPPPSSFASRRRPVAPDIYPAPEEPLADSVRRFAEQVPDRPVAPPSPKSSK
jgi:hypothetical protein